MPYRSQPVPPAAIEIELDDRSGAGVSGPGWVGILVLAVGLVVAFVTRFRVVLLLLFFPLGLGVLSVISRWFRRRFARLTHGTLFFEIRGLWGRRRLGSVATDGGVSIETRGVSIVVNGIERTTLRVVGSRGAVSWRSGGAQRQMDRLREVLESRAVAIHDGTAPLAGAVSVSAAGGGTIIEWRTARDATSSRKGAIVVVGVVVLFVWLLAEGAGLATSGVGILILSLILGTIVWSIARAQRSEQTTLWIGPDGWTITRIRGATKDRDHGMERMEGRVLGGPDGPRLVVRSGDREVLVVDDGLSQAELRYIADRIEQASTVAGPNGDGHSARA